MRKSPSIIQYKIHTILSQMNHVHRRQSINTRKTKQSTINSQKYSCFDAHFMKNNEQKMKKKYRLKMIYWFCCWFQSWQSLHVTSSSLAPDNVHEKQYRFFTCFWAVVLSIHSIPFNLCLQTACGGGAMAAISALIFEYWIDEIRLNFHWIFYYVFAVQLVSAYSLTSEKWLI